MSRMAPLAAKVKATRHTSRPDAPFGAGILRSAPYYGRQPFTAADLEWAAQEFGRDADWDARMAADAGPDWDTLAGEARFVDAASDLTPPVRACRSCGEPADDLNAPGWCDRCDREGTDASIACVNARFGLGHRVF
jgi:hypothetical protein